MERSRVFISLVHYPVYNKKMEVIATSITNLDLHDISRVTATYGLERYYVIHPHQVQRELAQEIVTYWQVGFGAQYNPDRRQAFGFLRLVSSIEEAITDIATEYQQPVQVIVTDARTYPNSISYIEMRQRIENIPGCYLLVFGTGWGLTREFMAQADYILEPIYGRAEYNHLSVRSAVAIIVDRLCGSNWWQS
ncbi:MAG: RNA methyltransferase [Firmicutes bacterium]|nr:RNA methyltransferase [Bacillota bacterium]